ncbi:MAG: prepilin peptidase [Desulfobacteraceae bacterium]|nr:prepilin peptidase [Desulfobacteraceae bacterium]
MTPLIFLIPVFIFGLCIGSFLNVCIYRLPISKSILFPGSMCSRCGTPVKFYDNIPVLSYILLRGKCRNCGIPFSFRYPMVEAITGLMAVSLFLKYGLSPESLVYFVFICCLLVITFIDMDHQIIPDVISLPGIPIFFIASFALPSASLMDTLVNSGLGILIGGGSLLTVGLLYTLLTKKEGMGGGDIKLLAMMGGLIGWKGILFTIFISSAVGSIIGIVLMLRMKKDMKLAIPFGPFLSIGAMTYIFFGQKLISWYLNIL